MAQSTNVESVMNSNLRLLTLFVVASVSGLENLWEQLSHWIQKLSTLSDEWVELFTYSRGTATNLQERV